MSLKVLLDDKRSCSALNNCPSKVSEPLHVLRAAIEENRSSAVSIALLVLKIRRHYEECEHQALS